MPILNPAIIADVRAKIDAQFGPIPSSLTGAQQSTCDSFRQKLAVCIAEAGLYVRDNAVVTSTVAVASVSGVTSGGSLSGPGTGTATGTIL